MKDIVLTTINAKWIHPSLALRLLKANLGELEDQCEIVEFALRQPLQEKIDALSVKQPRILGISVSIWNHTATIELLKELKKIWKKQTTINHEVKDNAYKSHHLLPVIVLGGPEVSHLPQDAEIFQYADFVIRGEGEIAFRELCEKILAGESSNLRFAPKFINAEEVDISQIKTAYYLYTDEDITRKLIYVESSRGCPFSCEFCMSSIKEEPRAEAQKHRERREFLLEDFFSEINVLILRGVKTFKFLDRTFNSNIKRAIQICEFFIKKSSEVAAIPTVHFEIVPTLITPELIETLARFPPNSLRLEIGIQTLDPEVAERIGLPGRSGKIGKTGKTAEQILEPIRLLREKTNAIIHADLIAGLPGETLESFGKGFDALLEVLGTSKTHGSGFEVQLGILKQLPGAPIARHNEAYCMRYNPKPPYEVLETSAMSAKDLVRLKNFARFWELLVNRGLFESELTGADPVFYKFMALSDALFAHFGRNWGINKEELLAVTLDFWQ